MSQESWKTSAFGALFLLLGVTAQAQPSATPPTPAATTPGAIPPPILTPLPPYDAAAAAAAAALSKATLTDDYREAALRDQPVVITDWEHKPTDQEIAAAYPAAAFDRERDGRVAMECVVAADYTLADCELRTEPTDKTLGFGAAAMPLAALFKVRPTTALKTTRYGYLNDYGDLIMVGGDPIPLIGAKVVVGIDFSFLRTQLIREGSIKLTNATIASSTSFTRDEQNAAIGAALLDIAQRNLSSDGIRAAMRQAMIDDPAVWNRFSQFLYGGGEKTQPLKIERLASGLLQVARMDEKGAVTGRFTFDLNTGSLDGFLVSLYNSPTVPIDAPLPAGAGPALALLRAREQARTGRGAATPGEP